MSHTLSKDSAMTSSESESSSLTYLVRETTIYEAWEKSSAMASDASAGKPPYTIMMPPPNVTGNLHMGHALTFTLQDILVRHARKRGFDVLWQPGTDHAGISTQMVVERQLAQQGLDRRTLGRQVFEKKVWEWKDQYGAAITHQLRRLGASPDWTRERFTLDEGLKHAVTAVFVQLYKQGLIYRDKRLVHWDTKLLTAISDIEVDNKEIDDQFCYLRYPSASDPDKSIVVATTRPETLFGDVAVAVHPDDARYQSWIGSQVVLPLTGRTIPVVADAYCDPEKGTGAVKITPAHDFNDFDVAKRQNLPMLTILTETGLLNDTVPERFQGLNCSDARAAVLAALEAQGFIDKIEPIRHSVPHGDRTGVRLEPRLTDQWFVDAQTLAQPAIQAVESGETRFVPDYWSATYFAWLRNIQPWCISRQLWWGHRIPAWFGPDDHIFVAMDAASAAAQAQQHYGHAVDLRQDEDVLDTWFSSALWPFSTLHWPQAHADLQRYYPSDVLVTGNDIIFFWVARMMMMGLHFMKASPFKEIYIHALVRDEKGQKMSKSKGNVVDPLGLMDTYGTDALRFALALQAAPGRDIKLATSRVEGARNFATKLRNAVRFCKMQGAKPGFVPENCRLLHNQWMVAQVHALAERLDEALQGYRFHEAAQMIQREIWGSFCDWYVEFCKPIMQGRDTAAHEETQQAMFWALTQLLHRLNPFMPFVTEELWAQLNSNAKHSEHISQDAGADDNVDAVHEGPIVADIPLLALHYPGLGALPAEASQASRTMAQLIVLISAVRGVFAEFRIPPKTRLKAYVKEASATTRDMLAMHQTLLLPTARLASCLTHGKASDVPQDGVITLALGECVLVLAMEGAIDMTHERQRLQKEMIKYQEELKIVAAKLANDDFRQRAPQEIIDGLHERAHDAQQRVDKCQRTLESLG